MIGGAAPGRNRLGGRPQPGNASKYDLPTEAQWEMAARGTCEKNGKAATDDAGCKAAMRTYPWGEAVASCTYAVMSNGNGGGCGTNTTAVVGSKLAGDSPYGVHDMSGNVWEWVRDWYSGNYYGSSPGSDPLNSAAGTTRAFRGEFFNNFKDFVRGSVRGAGYPPDSGGHLIGLRCSRSF